MASRTWVGHLLQGLTAPGRRKGGGLPRGAPGGPGVSPPASERAGAHKQALQGTRSKAEFPVPASIWPGQAAALCRWTQEWLGWPEIPSVAQAC